LTLHPTRDMPPPDCRILGAILRDGSR
jgi:hypothetical protein